MVPVCQDTQGETQPGGCQYFFFNPFLIKSGCIWIILCASAFLSLVSASHSNSSQAGASPLHKPERYFQGLLLPSFLYAECQWNQVWVAEGFHEPEGTSPSMLISSLHLFLATVESVYSSSEELRTFAYLYIFYHLPEVLQTHKYFINKILIKWRDTGLCIHW